MLGMCTWLSIDALGCLGTQAIYGFSVIWLGGTCLTQEELTTTPSACSIIWHKYVSVCTRPLCKRQKQLKCVQYLLDTNASSRTFALRLAVISQTGSWCAVKITFADDTFIKDYLVMLINHDHGECVLDFKRNHWLCKSAHSCILGVESLCVPSYCADYLYWETKTHSE